MPVHADYNMINCVIIVIINSSLITRLHLNQGQMTHECVYI